MLERLKQSSSFWMILACFCFAIMGVFVKLGSQQFSVAELVFYRCIAGLAGIFVVVLLQGKTLKVNLPMFKLHMSRCVAGFIALLLYFYAIVHLALPTAVTLSYTSPLFLTLITIFYLKNKLQPRQTLAILIGFVGVVILLKPTFESAQWLAGLMGLGSGLLSGVAYFNVNKLGQAGEPEWRTVFYFSLVSTTGAAILMSLQDAPLTFLNLNNIWIVAGLGVSATIAQLGMTRAYSRGKTLTVASLAYLTVLFATVFAALLWDEQLSWASYIAMALIAACGILSSAFKKSVRL
ncbi:DMT family transporter [Iodobacter fluviatilis]|uniref:EamA domain-containing membrane protein RarD n=1 Tax=Iodobacter fluviatilis TaxID=537 RepID=A0A377Q8Q5_9NEIS|nr:DMT family transporter [Iodobacter fluviatilis]TCU82419.1 EamA domain-containing membrane protein RarD [Iodobacter fluviatilis]STQ91644.1 Predicted permeases [Iodobacter fluviatilis]